MRRRRIENYVKSFMTHPYNYRIAEQLFAQKPITPLYSKEDVQAICQDIFRARPAIVPYVNSLLYYLILVKGTMIGDYGDVAVSIAVDFLVLETDFDPPWTLGDYFIHGFSIISDLFHNVTM